MWAPRLADHLEREGDVLGDGLVGQQPEVLEDGADLAAQRGTFQLRSRLRSLPATKTWPLVGAVLAQHQPQEGRLAGAGLTDEEDELALVDVGGHVDERRLGVPGDRSRTRSRI